MQARIQELINEIRTQLSAEHADEVQELLTSSYVVLTFKNGINAAYGVFSSEDEAAGFRSRLPVDVETTVFKLNSDADISTL